MTKSQKAVHLLIGLVTGLAIAFAAVGAYAATTVTPETNPNQIAEQFGATIAWFDDESPCGGEDVGCYTSRTPNTIYIRTGLEPDVQRSVILHELGHLTQARLGLPRDECKADEFAKSLGATVTAYC